MKRFQKVIIIIVLIFFSFGQIMISFADKKTANSLYGDNMLEYMRGNDDNLLLLHKNYGYMTLVENFKSDWVSLYFLKMTDIFARIGSEPDKVKYMEVLLNIIATYDLDNASVISEQNNLDNMKEFKDYTLDFMGMGKDAISIIIGNSSTASHLESSIVTAIDGLAVLANNTDTWITAISNLETIIQNYEKYDGFLKLIEEKGEDELKEAATILRKGMSEAFEIKLDTYLDVSNENFENYNEFFFSDVFFTILKQSSQYSSDENIKFFVDCGDNIVTKIGSLESSWDLGVMIGKLVGNVAVGGENIINRLLEMMALHDISVILQGEIIGLSNEFLKKYGTEEEEAVIESYVLYSQYLVGCRIRGEYCVYSTVANDAGLMSWFGKKSAEEAKTWYENKVDKILDIQNNLLNIYDASESDVDDKELATEVTEERLKKLLTENDANAILNFVFDDFDNNGVFEAIAFCGEYYKEDGSYFGTLYFVSQEGVKVIREEDGYWDSGQVYDFGNAKIIAITQYFTTGGLTYYYQVNGNEVIEIEGSGYGAGLYQDEQGRMCMTDSQYDACVDGTGHTWNVYYFYWDNGLKEYGGTQIPIDEFQAYNGADEIIRKITEDGYEITTIYKRENGILNVNCCNGWSNANVRIIYDNENVELLPVTEDFYYEEGIIKPALIPDIATY